MKNEMYGAVSPSGTSTGESGKPHSESESDSEAEEAVEELPVAKMGSQVRGPRMSVSAEVFGKFNKKEEFQPPVYPKTEEQTRAIKTRMEGNFMFESLNPVEKKQILDAVQPVKFGKNKKVIEQGADGDNFYLIEKGELKCFKKFKEGEADTFLKDYKPGESFGELALLYNAPRAATIICVSEECELWSLDRNTFNHIIKTAVQKKREKYDTFLENVEILKCMERYERTRLADALKEEWYEDGAYIIKEGDKDGDRFYMIIEG